MSQCGIYTILTSAAARTIVNRVIQGRLTIAALIYQQVGGQHILPGAVEEGYLPPAVGASELDLPCLLQIGCNQLFRYSCVQ